MKFECKKTGTTQYGVWAIGTFSVGELIQIVSIVEIISALEIKENEVYKVKKVLVKSRRNGTLRLILDI